jgi:hypothetical protein
MSEDRYEKKLQAVLIVLTVLVIFSAGYYIYIVLNMDSSNVDHITRPGDHAKSYLQNTTYSDLFIEVDYIGGFEPSDSTIEAMIDMLEEYTDKETIEYELSDKIEESDVMAVYNINDVYDLEQKYRDSKIEGDTIFIYILFLNGEYEESGNTLGVSYQGTSFAIFKEKVDSVNIPLGVSRYVKHSDFERSVVIHETGHLLGLVNINYQSIHDHEDEDSINHCIYEDCVMYHALEHSRQSFMEKLFEREDLKPPIDFCADCEDDLINIKQDQY